MDRGWVGLLRVDPRLKLFVRPVRCSTRCERIALRRGEIGDDVIAASFANWASSGDCAAAAHAVAFDNEKTMG